MPYTALSGISVIFRFFKNYALSDTSLIPVYEKCRINLTVLHYSLELANYVVRVCPEKLLFRNVCIFI